MRDDSSLCLSSSRPVNVSIGLALKVFRLTWSTSASVRMSSYDVN